MKNRPIYNKLHWNLGMLYVADPKLYCLMQKIYSIILGLITIGIIDPNEICIAMIDGNVSILVVFWNASRDGGTGGQGGACPLRPLPPSRFFKSVNTISTKGGIMPPPQIFRPSAIPTSGWQEKFWLEKLTNVKESAIFALYFFLMHFI